MPNSCQFYSLSLIVSTRSRRGALLEVVDQRFEAFPDPCDNWIVWDNDEDNFAEVGTRYLTSLSESSARSFCSLLNRLLPRRIEHHQQDINARPSSPQKRNAADCWAIINSRSDECHARTPVSTPDKGMEP
jgi:hypothetical protein